MTQRKSHVLGRKRYELTPRQREVLERIAAGKTNFEIAQDLGIGLEGVKHHVSEILGRLGVESREQAAERWREQQSWHRRLRGVVSTGWAKWVAAGSGAAVVAAVAVVLLALQSDEPPARAGLPPGMWVAVVETAAFLDSTQPPRPIRLHNLVDGEERAIGEPGRYLNPRFSPDGRLLAVMILEGESPDDSPSLLILGTDADFTIYVDFEGLILDYEWSPDASRLALITESGPLMISSDGTMLSDVQAPDPVEGMSLTGQSWSPDSHSFAVIFNRKLQLLDRDGKREVFEPNEVLPDVGPGGLSVLGWKDPQTLYIGNASVRFGYYAIKTRTGTLEAEPALPDEILASNPPLPEAVTSRYERPSPLRLTADGSGWILTIQGPVEGFAVVVGDESTTVEQPHGNSINLRGIVDVVIVP